MSAVQIELEALVGLRVLDGRGEFIGEKRDYYSDRAPTVFVLRLDGVLYWFQEDPDDGYRSSLNYVRTAEIGDLPPGSFVEFPPMTVNVGIQTRPPAGDYSTRDYRLYGVNEATGLVVFEVGTTNLDDYYPSFTARWDPNGYEPYWLPAEEDTSKEAP